MKLRHGSGWTWVGAWVLGASSTLVGCGGEVVVEPDAAIVPVTDAGPGCEDDLDCDDGLQCNGRERCDEQGRCAAGTPLRCDDAVACTTDYCSDELQRCVNRPPDVDEDGVYDAACLDARGVPLGQDCDDTRPNVRPGAVEVCDEAGLDEDCDATTLGSDADGDGFQSAECCNGAACGDDCNDAVRTANPLATEVCNGIDDDCDGDVDEGVLVAGYRDADGDGHGDPTAPMTACGTRAGFSTSNDDCDDTNALRSPSLPEVCDGIDNDCNGIADPADSTVVATWYLDADGDGFGAPLRRTVSCAVPTGSWSLYGTDCDDTVATVSPAQAERCNGRDDDCNGRADFEISAGDFEDDDGDGIADARCVPTPVPADCDDRNPSSGPGSAELCDGRDNDCDGRVDEMVASFAYFRDADGDGYGGAAGGVMVGCVPPVGYTTRGGDCDDTDPRRYPGARERCGIGTGGGVDDDCDAAIDEAPASSECTPTSLHQDRACLAAECRVVGCSEGWSDCDGNLMNGCETPGPCSTID